MKLYVVDGFNDNATDVAAGTQRHLVERTPGGTLRAGRSCRMTLASDAAVHFSTTGIETVPSAPGNLESVEGASPPVPTLQ